MHDGCVICLSVWGFIRLSYRQAEGRRVRFAVLCLKYILALGALGAAALMYSRAEAAEERALFTACGCAAGVALLTVRGGIRREAFLASSLYLTGWGQSEPLLPPPAQTVCGEAICAAVRTSIRAAMLAPSYITLRAGLNYYSLSSERENFLLLLAASALLAAAGGIFAGVTNTRLICAEYILLSGGRRSMTSALDASWELTRGNCGDALRLRIASFFFGGTLSAICRMNFSQRLTAERGIPTNAGLYIRLAEDAYGEIRPEITI